METISIVILIGTLFLIFMMGTTGFIIYTAQQKKNKLQIELHQEQINRHKDIAVNTLRSQEKERRRIGLDLHDELGPSFSIVKMNIARIKQKLGSGQELEIVESLADEASMNLDNAIEKFSNLSKLLYPIILTRYGLTKSIEDIMDRSFNRTNINVKLEVQEISTDSELMQISIYRLIQELAHNTLKHAEAKNVEIKLHDDANNIFLYYSDDGKGFDLKKLKTGLGLDSIKGRMDAIRGIIDMETSEGKGLKVNVTIPHER